MPEIEKVRSVFQRLPAIYDRMNTLMSMGLDVFWRIDLLKLMPETGRILDVGTGTGKLEDLSVAHSEFIGLDITKEMMMLNKNAGRLFVGSATCIPFRDNSFDGIISSFVLRNLPLTTEYFSEGFRILREGGIMANLDAFPEERKWVSIFFSVYFYKFIPKLGEVISSTNSYNYLASTVKNFKKPFEIAEEMKEAGFRDVKVKKFFSPSASIVSGRK